MYVAYRGEVISNGSEVEWRGTATLPHCQVGPDLLDGDTQEGRGGGGSHDHKMSMAGVVGDRKAAWSGNPGSKPAQMARVAGLVFLIG